MDTYRVTTDGGTYDVTTDDGASSSPVQDKASSDMASISPFEQQMTKAMYNSAPFGKDIVNGLMGKQYGQAIQNIPQAQGMAQGAGQLVGQGLSSLPAMAGGAAMIPGKILGGALGIGAQQAGQASSSGANPLQSLGQGAMAAGETYAGVKALNMLGNTLGALPTALNSAKASQFAQSVRQAFVGVKKAAVDKFGSDIADLAAKNPDKTVSLGDVVKNISDNWTDMSNNAKSAFKSTPILRDFIPQADGTVPPGASAEMENVKLSDIQKIINHLNTHVPGNIKSNDLDLLNTLSDVKAAQLDAFPQMAKVRSDYSQIAQPYKNVQNYFKFNKVLGGIKSGFGGDEGQNAVNQLLPKDVLRRMSSYKSAANLTSGTKAAIPEALKLAGVGAVGTAIVKHHL